jgi:hypothetical protein
MRKTPPQGFAHLSRGSAVDGFTLSVFAEGAQISPT